MIPLVTPAEMGAADARTIKAGTPESELMDRAGRAVAWRVRSVAGGTYGRRAVVLCGKGNNGGDGQVAAAALRAWGMRVRVVDVEADEIGSAVESDLARAHVIVDAMYGTGFRGELAGRAARATELTAASDAIVVAVDIPSGVDGLTGATPGIAVRADHTVTFAAPKPGLWFYPGRALAGVVTVADIGIDLGPNAGLCAVMTDADVAAWVPRRSATTHKWRSSVLVIGGSLGMTGAPMMVARAAMRLGAGIAWAAMPGRAAELASGTEVITRRIGDEDGLRLTPASVPDLIAMSARFGAVVAGPGLGTAPETMTAVQGLVAEIEVPLVLDADGLTAFASVAELLAARRAPTVLTPHDGEYARLAGGSPTPDRIAAARVLADRTRATVLLKGPTTVVADPDGRVRLNPTGGPGLATAGAGDVLGGFIGAFLAQGMNTTEAAAAAAFVHGRAADQGGHTGLLAGELPARAAVALAQIHELAPEA